MCLQHKIQMVTNEHEELLVWYLKVRFPCEHGMEHGMKHGIFVSFIDLSCL